MPSTLRFIRLDLPGFGDTPLATEPRPDILSRAEFVTRALDTLGVESCTLLGHSMGGTVVLATAARDPRCCAVALLASAGLRPHRLLRRAVASKRVARLVDHAFLGRPTAALVVRFMRSFGFPSNIPRSEFVHAARCVAAIDFNLQREHSAALQPPTLVAWSDDDPLIETEIFEELGRGGEGL